MSFNCFPGKPAGCISADTALQQTSNFVDRHISLFKNTPYVLLGIGGFLIARKLKVMTHFTCIKDIPQEFILKNILLRGQVARVSDDCVLHIKHIPIIKRPLYTRLSSAAMKAENDMDCLPIYLGGINIPESMIPNAAKELKKLENDGAVWFKLWHGNTTENPSHELPRLYCVVFRRKWPFNVNVNGELLRLGYAVFSPLPEKYSRSKTSERLTRQLVKAEKYAMKKRHGVWYEPTKLQQLSETAALRYQQVRSKTATEHLGTFYRWMRDSILNIFKRKKDV